MLTEVGPLGQSKSPNPPRKPANQLPEAPPLDTKLLSLAQHLAFGEKHTRGFRCLQKCCQEPASKLAPCYAVGRLGGAKI